MVYRYPMRMLNVCTLWWLFGNHIIQKQSFFICFIYKPLGGLLYYLKESLDGLFIGVDHGYPLIIHCSSSIAACSSYLYLGSGVVFFWHQVLFIFKECVLSFELFAPMLFRKHLVKIYLSWINVEFLKVKAKTINNNFFLYIFLSIAIIYFTYVYL